MSIFHGCHPILVALVWELTQKNNQVAPGLFSGLLRLFMQNWKVPTLDRRVSQKQAQDTIGVGRFRGGRGAARAEEAQGTPTQIQGSPSILVYEDKLVVIIGTSSGLGRKTAEAFFE